MIVRMFKPQFAPMVRAGTKCQTVRPVPQRWPKVNEELSLREWTGLPYRSKQRILRESRVQRVVRVTIHASDLYLGGFKQNEAEVWKFATLDGFNTPDEFFDWFAFHYYLPFEGIVICWPPPGESCTE